MANHVIQIARVSLALIFNVQTMFANAKQDSKSKFNFFFSFIIGLKFHLSSWDTTTKACVCLVPL